MAKIGRVQIWLWPELRILEDEATQLKLLKRTFSWRQTIAVSCAVTVVMLLLIPSVAWPIKYWLDPYPLWQLLSVPLVAVLITSIWISFLLFLMRGHTRRAIRRELRNMGISVCMHCGYDTRDLPEDRCPECGRALEAEGDQPRTGERS